MNILDTFFIMFQSDASKLDKGLKDSEGKAAHLAEVINKTDAGASKLGGTFLDLATKGAGLLGVGLSLGALFAGVKNTAEANNQLAILAARFKTTAGAIDDFVDAAALIGLSDKTAVDGLMALDRAINDTAMDMGRSKKVFEEIGVKVEDLHGKVRPTTDVMADLQKKMAGFDKGKQIRVMERLGLDPSLLKLFNADMGDLRRRMEEIDAATGFSIERAVKRSQEFTKASKAMWVEIRTLKMYLDKFFENLNVMAMPWFTKAMEMATVAIRGFTDFMLKHGKFLEGIFVAIGAAIAYFLVPAAVSGAIAIWAMIAPFLLVGAIVVAIAGAFALLYDDIMNFIEGNDSLIGQILTKFPVIGTIVNGLVEVFKALGGAIMWAFQTSVDSAEVFYAILQKLVSGLADVAVWFGEVTGWTDMFKGVFQLAGFIIGAVWDMLTGKAGIFLDIINVIVGVLKGLGAAVTTGLGAAKNLLGIGDASTSNGLAAGQAAIAQTNNPLASTSSGAITGAGAGGDKNTTVSIGKVEVNTQATDAQGIARDVGTGLNEQMRQAVNRYDDGIAI